MLKRLLFVGSVGLVICASGCATKQVVSEERHYERGVVVVESNVDVTISFNGGALAPVRANSPDPLTVIPGTYAVEVKAPGYLTRRYDLRVDSGEWIRIRAEMWPAVDEIDGDEGKF